MASNFYIWYIMGEVIVRMMLEDPNWLSTTNDQINKLLVCNNIQVITHGTAPLVQIRGYSRYAKIQKYHLVEDVINYFKNRFGFAESDNFSKGSQTLI